MNEQQHPRPTTPGEPPVPPSPPSPPDLSASAIPPLPPPRRGADWMFGGVYGTVLASGLLAALDQKGGEYTPFYDASWVLVTAATAGLAHGYSHHMSTHQAGSAGHRWRILGRALWNEWPMIAATLPTVLLLLVAGLTDWDSHGVTAVGLGVNTAMLFAWGAFVALRVGYKLGSALLIGVADATIGLAIIAANAVIK
ncbi:MULTISPECIES: hypothetical protein [unclassified Streptomyces]|uniref:hypothetical protein n=1 Tax=unclassified Streptomyces TaxID=2593676 RepID=UPI002030C537|nr:MULTISPECIES: hypothetical protein [unclassified Streptomyces]MCM1969930.1 hypothetical protein [Streptomyces sp. G1]MCX5125383.1 hypothetical protein [Streptomyces sp. NBC_00347]MCX5298805.1 hypothetical protein [Streptomyces sp. NBC_00193]